MSVQSRSVRPAALAAIYSHIGMNVYPVSTVAVPAAKAPACMPGR
jgi:hypothetical protein